MPITSSAITDKSALATLGDSKESHSFIGRRPISLRPYQQEAREAVHREWQTRRSTLLVIPTGGGKTIIFSAIIEDCVRKGQRVLVLAHRSELLDQAADKLHKSTGLQCAVEKAEQSCVGSWFRVVVGSVQTL